MAVIAVRSHAARKVILPLSFSLLTIIQKPLLPTTDRTASMARGIYDRVFRRAVVTVSATRRRSSLHRALGFVNPAFSLHATLPQCPLLGPYPVALDQASLRMHGPIALDTPPMSLSRKAGVLRGEFMIVFAVRAI